MEEHKSATYINASYIKSAYNEKNPNVGDTSDPFGLIIATQGPKKNSVEAFWKMVVQNNVTRIVTLCHQIGNLKQESTDKGGRPQDLPEAVQYFPTEDQEFKTIRWGLNRIELDTDKKVVVSKHITTRTLNIIDQNN